MAVGVGGLSILLAFFVAIDTSEVYPPEVRETFVENSLAGQTFTQHLPADTAVVFMTGNFGVCKAKTGVVLPLSDLADLAKGLVREIRGPDNAAEGLRRAAAIEDIARSVLRMFHGELGVALLNLSMFREPPDFILRADIDESAMSFRDLLSKVAGALGQKPDRFLPVQEGEYLSFSGKLYVLTKDQRLYASNKRQVIEKFLSGVWKENSLSKSPLYLAVGEKVEFDQEQFLFVNVERIWSEIISNQPPSGRQNPLFASLFGNMRAMASSARLSDGNLNMLSAMMFKDLTQGIPKLIARPNAPSRAATFIPPDYSLLMRANAGSPLSLLQDMMALHPDAERGMRRWLDRVKERQGINLERDVLAAMSGDIAVSAKVPPMVGLPETLAVLRMTDAEKAPQIVRSTLLMFLGMGPDVEEMAFEEDYRGAKLRILPLPFVSLTYVLVESHLLVGSSPEVVKAAIDAHLSGKNLAASEGYRSAFEGHPSQSYVTIYADSQAMFNGLLNIGGGLAMWRGGDKEFTLIAARLIRLLRGHAGSLVPVGCTIHREQNAIVLKSNSRLLNLGSAPMLLTTLWVPRSHRASVERRELLRERAIEQGEMLERNLMMEEPVPQ